MVQGESESVEASGPTGRLDLVLISVLADAAEAAFESFLGSALKRKEAYRKKNTAMFGSITAIAELAGEDMNAVWSVSIRPDVALRIQEQSSEEIAADAEILFTTEETVFNIIDQVAEQVVRVMKGHNVVLNPGIPVVITGPRQRIQLPRKYQCAAIAFESNGEEVFTLDVHCVPE